MRTSTLIPKFQSALAAILLAGAAAPAQVSGGASTAGINAALTKLFGDVTAFSAKAEVQVLDDAQTEIIFTPMDFSLLDKKLRVEIDMAQARNARMPASVAASFKKMGLARVISIVRPDKGRAYVMYPDQKMLLSVPMSKEDVEAAEKSVKVQKTPLGKETVDGHPCTKNKVVVGDTAGQTLEATTWNASDLKDFPIQIQTQEGPTTSFVRFKQIQFVKPEANQFEPPASFAQYSDLAALQQAVKDKLAAEKEKK
jgi:hypothetical protein